MLASGIIFRYFAEDDESYLFEDKDIFDENGNLKVSFSKLTMGIDFGGNTSKTTFFLMGYMRGYKEFRGL